MTTAAHPIESLSPLQLLRQSEITVLDLFDNIPWFKTGADWTAWRAFLCALYALPMTEREFDIYRECTGRRDPPKAPAHEAYVPAGRRGRKSAVGSLVVVERALIPDYTGSVAPGQRALIPVLADEKANAQTIMGFVKAILKSTAVLDNCVEGEPGAETVRLVSDVDIMVKAASVSAGRSPAIPLAVLDEAAFFPTDDSAQPDEEIVRGIKPAMATFPNRLLLVMSSPYAKKGLLWKAKRDHFGQNGDVLVWWAPTLKMHDSPEMRVFVKSEYEKDPVSADSEYGAKFREDVTSPFDEDQLMLCTDENVFSRPPLAGVHYVAFLDPSGGASDAFTLCIAHWEAGVAKQDMLREWPAPYEPRKVVREASQVLKQYGLHSAEGDHYAGEWPADRFRDGLHADECPRSADDAAACACEPWRIAYNATADPKSDLYLEVLPHIRNGAVRLLDVARQRIQFAALERKTARGGRDSVDHPPKGHDDVANAAAGALVRAHRLRIGPRAVRPVPTNPVEYQRDNLTEILRNRLARVEKGQRPSRGGGGVGGL